jgi:serine/threonine-protein kinase
MPMLADKGPIVVGRYALHDHVASGGMATIHIGRLIGPVGFSRTVAIKRLHRHLVCDPSFAAMFAEEARLAARVNHPNVVATVDVVTSESEVLLVMEYIDGESLSRLWRLADGRIPRPIVVAVVSELLHGLHAAHEAPSENGEPLGIVHRDVSPQNVLVGADGVARLLDFGIARASGRISTTKDGDLKGKLAYMAPEQVRCEPVTRRTDVFAAGVVLWEMLAGKRLFASDNDAATIEKILVGWVPPPSSVISEVEPALDAVVMRALDPDPSKRFATAREMAVALEDALPRALGREVAEWVEWTGALELAAKRGRIAGVERASERRLVVERRSMPEETTWLVPPRATPARLGFPWSSRGVVFAGFAIAALLAAAGGRAAVNARTEARAMDAEIVAPIASEIVTPVATVTATITATATASPPPRPQPSPRRVAPAPPRKHEPARPAPCVGRFDPTTKKTVYEGDCE